MFFLKEKRNSFTWFFLNTPEIIKSKLKAFKDELLQLKGYQLILVNPESGNAQNTDFWDYCVNLN